MKLNYPTAPAPGTVVDHNKSEPDIRKRFIAVDFNTFSIDEQTQRPCVSTSVLRTADYRGEVYPIAMGGYEPRSIVEHYILRRKWTPYGYVKVWGYTPDCPPPPAKDIEPPEKPQPSAHKRMKMLREEYMLKQARCEAWYVARRNIKPLPPRDQAYVRLMKAMHRSMALGGGPREEDAILRAYLEEEEK